MSALWGPSIEQVSLSRYPARHEAKSDRANVGPQRSERLMNPHLIKEKYE